MLFFSYFCFHFLCLPSHFLHFRNILYNFCCLVFLFISCVLRYFLHFPMLLLSFPLLTLTFLLHISCIFANILFNFYCLTFSLHFLCFTLFPAFSHAFDFISSAYHHIYCIFTVFSTISMTSSCNIQRPRYFPVHFPVLFLSFPLPNITFPACSRYFLAIHHISCIFTAFSRYFPAFSQGFSSVCCYFPAFL